MIAKHKHLQIFILAGLRGSGKTTVAEHMSQKGVPKITVRSDDSAKNILSQIQGIANAGQRNVVIDGLHDWDIYKAIKHDYHGQTTTVVITASRHNRHHRLTKRIEDPLTNNETDQYDYADIEKTGEGGIIAFADVYIDNNGNLEDLREKVDDLLHEHEP